MKKLIAATILPLLFIGCSDKPKEESKTASSTAQPESKIEIVESKNAHEIKIEKKADDRNKSDAYYYDYHTKKKKSAQKEEEEPRSTVDAYSHLRSPYEAVEIQLITSKLSKEFIVKCSPCHDDYGNGIIGPSLLAKDGKFIYERIIDYKNGTKNNPLMTDLVKQMSDEQLKNIAEEIAAFNKKIQEMREGKK